MEEHVLSRLILAKTIYRKAVEFCAETDDYTFSHGLIALHDGLDNFLGAVASIRNVDVNESMSLINVRNSIVTNERISDPTFQLEYTNEINQLNTRRNCIKHNGILPHIAQSARLIAPIHNFFIKYSLHFFNLDWDTISLADLIQDQDIKTRIKTIEQLIQNGAYKQALDGMAVIKFDVFDKSNLRMHLDPIRHLIEPSDRQKALWNSINIFPEQMRESLFDEYYDRFEFIESGISRELMSTFKDLTPTVGFYDNKDWKIVKKYNHDWASPNWTKKNAIFCYDFLVDAVLKKQKSKYSTSATTVLTIYTIQATEKVSINLRSQGAYIMDQNETRHAIIFDRVDKQWQPLKGDILIRLYEDDTHAEVLGNLTESERNKIKFLHTKVFTYQDSNWKLFEEYDGG